MAKNFGGYFFATPCIYVMIKSSKVKCIVFQHSVCVCVRVCVRACMRTSIKSYGTTFSQQCQYETVECRDHWLAPLSTNQSKANTWVCDSI